jgi:hypothetical protein
MNPIAMHFEEIEKGEFLGKVMQKAKMIWGEINSDTKFFRTEKLSFVYPGGLLPKVNEGEEYPEAFLHECEDHDFGNGLHLVGCYLPAPDNICVIHSSTKI